MKVKVLESLANLISQEEGMGMGIEEVGSGEALEIGVKVDKSLVAGIVLLGQHQVGQVAEAGIILKRFQPSCQQCFQPSCQHYSQLHTQVSDTKATDTGRYPFTLFFNLTFVPVLSTTLQPYFLL